MGVYRRRYYTWDFATYTDHGEQGRRDRIARHFSRGAADRAFKRIRKIYSHESNVAGRENWRCWQEDRSGNEIINDTKVLDRAAYV